jgi:hypothetical protein
VHGIEGHETDVRLIGGDLGGQPGLAHPARAVQGHQAVPGQQLTDPVEVLGPPDEAGEPGRQRLNRGRRGALQQSQMDGLQLGRRVGPQLVGQVPPVLGIRGQGLGRLPGARQRTQQEGLRPLPQRLARHQFPQLGDEGLILADA